MYITVSFQNVPLYTGRAKNLSRVDRSVHDHEMGRIPRGQSYALLAKWPYRRLLIDETRPESAVTWLMSAERSGG